MGHQSHLTAIQHQVVATTIETLPLSPRPPLQAEDEQILTASPSNPLQQDYTPPRVTQGAFQALMLSGFTQCTPRRIITSSSFTTRCT